MAWFIQPILFCTDARWKAIQFISGLRRLWGSTCVSRVGFGVSPKQAFLGAMLRFGIGITGKVRDGGTPSPALGTSAVPGNLIRRWRDGPWSQAHAR
jgi:hypothetical protein